MRFHLQKGIVKGRQQGKVELMLRLLKRRLGALPASQEKAVRKLELSRIEALGEGIALAERYGIRK